MIGRLRIVPITRRDATDSYLSRMKGRYKEEMATLQASGTWRYIRDLVHDGKYVIEGGARMLNLSSNDYLGITSCSDMAEAFYAQLSGEDVLLGSSSSRLLTGNCAAYDRLEHRLAQLFGRDAALIYNSGYHLNTGVLPALTDERTLVVADRLVHASIIDGIRLSGRPFERFRHNDLEHLERIIRKKQDAYARIIIMVESIYSMDGDLADLSALCALKERYPIIELYVDEAHAIGVRGKTGLGMAEETGTSEQIDYLVGTFGKAIGSMGAYIVCDADVRDVLVNRSRSLIFSTALPPVAVAWTDFVMSRIASMTAERARLAAVSGILRKAIVDAGGAMPSESHIVPLLVGENAPCIELADSLRHEGFFALPIRHPTVPEHTARIRFSLSSAIEEEEVRRLIDLLPL